MIGRNQLRAELIVADSVGVSALIARVNKVTQQADGIRKRSS